MRRLLFQLFDFRINHKDVAFIVNEYVTRNKVPYLMSVVPESPDLTGFLKPQGSHIGINHYLCGRMGIGYTRLNDNRLDSTSVESGKPVESISGIRENEIVHHNLPEQAHYAAAIKKIVDLIDDLLSNIGVVFVAAWPRHSQVENIHHGNPIATSLGHRFGCALLNLKVTYIWLAISRLRFMYCAKSLEFIGDCCDAAIFRILRSVTSLWNWLRNVIVHSDIWFLPAKINIISETPNKTNEIMTIWTTIKS